MSLGCAGEMTLLLFSSSSIPLFISGLGFFYYFLPFCAIFLSSVSVKHLITADHLFPQIAASDWAVHINGTSCGSTTAAAVKRHANIL